MRYRDLGALIALLLLFVQLGQGWGSIPDALLAYVALWASTH